MVGLSSRQRKGLIVLGCLAFPVIFPAILLKYTERLSKIPTNNRQNCACVSFFHLSAVPKFTVSMYDKVE
jgi:hypothetical protein